MMQNSKVPSSSSNFSHPCPEDGYFDVFLSFRGKDTRYGFTRNLNHFLQENMVYTFMDVDLTGEDIEYIFTMIEKSRMAVVIYSESYASSDWCLKELDLILQLRNQKKMLIIPIFYNVDVHEVKHLTGNTKQYLDKHISKHDRSTVQKWMNVVKNFGNVSGLSYKISQARYEYDFIMDAIAEIKKKLRDSEDTRERCIVKPHDENNRENQLRISPIVQLRQEYKSSSTQILSQTNTTTGEEEFYRVVTSTYLQKSVEIMGKLPKLSNNNLIEGEASTTTSLELMDEIDNYVTFKRYSQDPWSGKKCIKLSSRSLSVAWGDEPSYWTWIKSSKPISSFEEVALLKTVCWFDIRGKMDTGVLSPGTCYGVYFLFKLVINAYGFENQPVTVRVGVTGAADHTMVEKSVYLDMEGRRRDQIVPKQRKDGWSEIEMGVLYVEESGETKDVMMRVSEVHNGHWKGGVMVEGIEIRPKD